VVHILQTVYVDFIFCWHLCVCLSFQYSVMFVFHQAKSELNCGFVWTLYLYDCTVPMMSKLYADSFGIGTYHAYNCNFHSQPLNACNRSLSNPMLNQTDFLRTVNLYLYIDTLSTVPLNTAFNTQWPLYYDTRR